MLVKILISAHEKLNSRAKIDIHNCEEKVYYSIINSCRNLGGNVLYHYLGGMIAGDYLDSTIHVEISRKDAMTFIKLIKETHLNITSIKYI